MICSRVGQRYGVWEDQSSLRCLISGTRPQLPRAPRIRAGSVRQLASLPRPLGTCRTLGRSHIDKRCGVNRDQRSPSLTRELFSTPQLSVACGASKKDAPLCTRSVQAERSYTRRSSGSQTEQDLAANDVLGIRLRVVRKTSWRKGGVLTKNRDVEFCHRSRLSLNLVKGRRGLDEKHGA